MVEYHKHKLEDGLEVLLSPNNYLHSASITVGFKYGLFNERNGETGVSHLIEHTLKIIFYAGHYVFRIEVACYGYNCIIRGIVF